MLLSVIVPVHNAAPWLAQMLDSLYAQRFVNREIILVDDGSTDGSGEILEAYRRRDRATRVVWQKHLGVSAARNRGMDLARGEYIAFPDADDVLEPDLYSELMRAARCGDLDVALCNARFLREGRPEEPILAALRSSGVVSGLEWLRHAIRARELLHAVWPGVYRASFLRRHALRFIPELRLRQDVPWTTRALAFAGRVQFTQRPLYCYRIGVRQAPPSRWKQIAQSYMSVVEVLERFHQEHAARLAPAMAELHWQLADQGLRIFHQTRHMAAPDQLAMFEEMRRRGTDRLILANARAWRQVWRVAKRLAWMRLALSAEAWRRAAFFAPALRRHRAP